MSTSLYARPKPVVSDYPSFYSLKWILAPRYFGHDGSLSSDKVILDASDIPFLEGAMAAASRESKAELKELIGMIQKHEAIEIWTE